MKGERHLKLVPPTGAPGDEDPRAALGQRSAELDEPPPTEAELREAQELERALERGIDPLAAALRSAYRPDPLEDLEHEALLARALGNADADADAPATKAETREAERLAEELETGNGRRAPAGPKSEPAELAGALKAAWAPRSIEPLRNEALIAKALQKMPSKRRRALPVTMAALSTLAAVAAGVALFFSQGSQRETSSPTAAAPTAGQTAAQAALIRARSTTDLFDPGTPFPVSGGTSERMDRIVSARSADLRANRFAAWGVP